MYNMEREQERVLVGYEGCTSNLIKISAKLMFLRSFIRPYFSELRDENGSIIIGESTLSEEIKILQGYTTVSFPQLKNT